MSVGTYVVPKTNSERSFHHAPNSATFVVTFAHIWDCLQGPPGNIQSYVSTIASSMSV